MLPDQYSSRHFVFAGTRPVRDEEKQADRDKLHRIPGRIWRGVLWGIISWPLCLGPIWAVEHFGGRNLNPSLRVALWFPFLIGLSFLLAHAITLETNARNDFVSARRRLKAEQIERWERLPEEDLDYEDKEAWEAPIWVEVMANTTTIWDEEYDDYEDEDDEELGNGGNPWSGKGSPWNG